MTFDIDANGILDVSAKDKATGREQRIKITASSGLSKDEVDHLVKDAAKFAEEDRKHKEEVETRNNADSGAYQAEKLLRDLGDKMPAEMKSEIEAKVAALRQVIGGKDIADIKAKTEDLARTLQKMGEKMYQQTGEAGTPPPPPGGEGEPKQSGKGDTVEGEFREVKE